MLDWGLARSLPTRRRAEDFHFLLFLFLQRVWLAGGGLGALAVSFVSRSTQITLAHALPPSHASPVAVAFDLIEAGRGQRALDSRGRWHVYA